MAKLTEKEIEQLQQELKEKTEEIKVIYDKLVEAGEAPLSDDILDTIAGGYPHADDSFGVLSISFEPPPPGFSGFPD